MYGSDIVTMQNAQSADYLSTPIAAIPADLANPVEGDGDRLCGDLRFCGGLGCVGFGVLGFDLR